jgi:hypothetical protein
MFVVRHVIEREVSNTKAFALLKAAEDHFWAGWRIFEACDGASARLYRVPNSASAADAVSAVRNRRSGVTLMLSLPTCSVRGLLVRHSSESES